MRECRECTAYSRGVKGEEELEEEAVSFCAASDKSRGREGEARPVQVRVQRWLERGRERSGVGGFTGKRERRCLG